MNLKQIVHIFFGVLGCIFLIVATVGGLCGVIWAYKEDKKSREGETKKTKTIKKRLIELVKMEVEIYGSLPDFDWTQRFKLLLYGPVTMLLGVITLIPACIAASLNGELLELLLGVWFCIWVFIWFLIFLFYTFHTAYSDGFDEGYKVAREPKPTIEIRNTWPAHIYHACKTLVLLSFVILFFPWFIAYRLGKLKGRRDYHIQEKEYSEPTDETEVNKEIEKEIELVRKFRDSRAQHYAFAHQALRDLFFDSPDEVLAILKDEHRDDLLLDLWNRVGEEVGKSSLIAADGLSCEIRMLDDTTVGMIILPAPQILNEAYFVALVYRPCSSDRKLLTRFICLERGVHLDDGSPPSVLCEWDSSGTHSNMGHVCEPNLEDFFEAVSGLLQFDPQDTNTAKT